MYTKTKKEYQKEYLAIMDELSKILDDPNFEDDEIQDKYEYFNDKLREVGVIISKIGDDEIKQLRLKMFSKS